MIKRPDTFLLLLGLQAGGECAGIRELTKMGFIASLREKVSALRKEIAALSLAIRHPGTPWTAKLLALIIVAYALSPIDLIPDFIPVIGLLDDLVLLPIGIAIVIKMIPQRVMDECRKEALQHEPLTKKNWIAALFIVLLWISLSVIAISFLSKAPGRLRH